RLPQPGRLLVLEVGGARADAHARARAGPHDITVNTICPNVTHGERMTKIVNEKARRLGRTPQDVYAEFTAQTALGRFIEDSDIAHAVRFLVSAGGRNVTGHDVVVDGGWDV